MNAIHAKEELIKNLISELKGIEKRVRHTTEVGIYEGKEGIRTVVNLALKNGAFYSFGATGRAFYALYEMPVIAKSLKSHKFKVKVIGNKKYQKTEPFLIEGVDYKFLDVDSEATTSVFGDYVSIHLLTDKPLFILIRNKEIANSYRNHFELLWKIAAK